jgi:hypothetical protein
MAAAYTLKAQGFPDKSEAKGWTNHKHASSQVAAYFAAGLGVAAAAQLAATVDTRPVKLVLIGEDQQIIHHLAGTWRCRDEYLIALTHRIRERVREFLDLSGVGGGLFTELAKSHENEDCRKLAFEELTRLGGRTSRLGTGIFEGVSDDE